MALRPEDLGEGEEVKGKVGLADFSLSFFHATRKGHQPENRATTAGQGEGKNSTSKMPVPSPISLGSTLFADYVHVVKGLADKFVAAL